MARDYISHGIRARAQDLVTLELGPETELERLAKLGNEVGQERLTRLDRSLLVRAKDNVLVLTGRDEADAARHTMRLGRLRTLERMGLATEKQAGVWALDPEIEVKLRRLGDRADKIKMMQRALAEAGVERMPGSYALFDRGSRRHPLTGKVIGVGMIDEITDRTWTVVDGIDGRVHYVELGRLTPDKVPRRGDVVRISADRLDGKPQAAPRLAVLSRSAGESLPGYDGPTWLDRIVATGDPTLQPRGGFGGEAARDLEARRQWLIAQDLGRSKRRWPLRAAPLGAGPAAAARDATHRRRDRPRRQRRGPDQPARRARHRRLRARDRHADRPTRRAAPAGFDHHRALDRCPQANARPCRHRPRAARQGGVDARPRSCAAGSRQVSVWRMQVGLPATARICTRFTAIPSAAHIGAPAS